MADHGDDVAELLLNRTINTSTARDLIRYILELGKKRAEANKAGVLSEDMGKNTVEYNTDYYDLSKLKGFEAEKLSSFDYAAIKAYAIKETFNIDCMQVKDCLLYKSIDFAKVKTDSAQKSLQKALEILYQDKDKIADIITAAKIADQKIEQKLFSKLPHKNVDLNNVKQSINVAKTKADITNALKTEVAQDKTVTIKRVLNNAKIPSKDKITARAKTASIAKPTQQKKVHKKQIGQHLSK